MNALLVPLGIWLGTSAVIVAALLWSTRNETIADLGPQQHDPDCGACAVADDPTLVSFDLTLWAMEMEGSAS